MTDAANTRGAHATAAAQPAPVSGEAVLALNTAMTEVYDDALAVHHERMLATTPVILGLFDGAGGRMRLYRPGQPVEEAPPVPVRYQYFKSVAHSTLAIYEIVERHGDDPGALGPALDAFGDANHLALDRLTELGLATAEQGVLASVLHRNRHFLEHATTPDVPVRAELAAYARASTPDLLDLIDLAAETQVSHWMARLDHWRSTLADSWTHVHAVVNTLYVTRQQNILFTLLAQFMGEEAIGDRLLLFETSNFTSTPAEMLDLLARVHSDRELGRTFFGDHHAMKDADILGDATRQVIEKEAARRGITPVLPPVAPLDSQAWPWPTDPASGTGPSTLREASGCPATRPGR
ncbi:hypothetical protein [Streptomyces boluensis]|uniref:hypothetical protein n=1 Tax=Streptomyces boluensis TaxID=1775135 RepID=UPI0016524E0D|nr:hypothetical protein [Streptomyces boluensis]